MTDRRQRLLDALVEITAERGLDHVSIREVAAAADVSIGTVQYYCRTKDEMVLMAWESLAEKIIVRAMGGLDRTAGTVKECVRRVVLELLPLDEPRNVESRVYLAFAARAAVSAPLAEVQHSLLGELRGYLARAFARAKDEGEAAPGLEPDAAAATTAALVDGLLLHMLTDRGGLPPDSAVAAMDAHLDRLLPTTP
ncbi:TetR/AcrR family transcriptional regulator [Actinoallomurus acaciae]|uniref:TetR/AcrR family transcriptional regulator n=1 Tax=Actinoallomurus acaciae TaxID=502577 RepID=A0ABV5YJ35_9ACTN